MKNLTKNKWAINKKQIASVVSLVLLLSLFTFISVSSAQGIGEFNLIKCPDGKCGFEDVIDLVKDAINAMIILSTAAATIAFAYAGIILLTSGGSENAKNKAKDIFTKVLKGYLWILVAWLLVYTISSVLLREGVFFLGKP